MRENINNFSSKLTIALALFMSSLAYTQDNLFAQNNDEEKIEEERKLLSHTIVQHFGDENVKDALINLSKSIEYTKDMSEADRKLFKETNLKLFEVISDQELKKYLEDLLNDLQFEEQEFDIDITSEDDDDAVYLDEMSDGDFQNVGKISSLNLEELEKLVEYINQYNKKSIALDPNIQLESKKVKRLLRHKYKNIIYLGK